MIIRIFSRLSFLIFSAALFSLQTAPLLDCHSSLYINNVIGPGVGIDKGYTVAKYMVYPKKEATHFFPFFDFRFLVSNEVKIGGSLGFGGRFQTDALPFIGGVNLYYDFREDHDLFHQIGVGFELRNLYGFDLTINGYFPLERKEVISNRVYTDYVDGYFVRIKPCQFTQIGTGVVLGKGVDFSDVGGGYFSLEGYYYNGNGCVHRNFVGAKASSLLFYKICRAGVSLSYDLVFGTVVQGEIGIRIPLGCKKKETSWGALPFVQRNDTIFFRSCTRWSYNY